MGYRGTDSERVLLNLVRLPKIKVFYLGWMRFCPEFVDVDWTSIEVTDLLSCAGLMVS